MFVYSDSIYIQYTYNYIHVENIISEEKKEIDKETTEAKG